MVFGFSLGLGMASQRWVSSHQAVHEALCRELGVLASGLRVTHVREESMPLDPAPAESSSSSSSSSGFGSKEVTVIDVQALYDASRVHNAQPNLEAFTARVKQGGVMLAGIRGVKISPHWSQPLPGSLDASTTQGLTREEALNVGQANNFAAKKSVSVSFENEDFKGASALEPHTRTFEPALRGSTTNPADMFKPRRHGGSPDTCKAEGLSEEEALAVGEANNFNANKSVAMSFENSDFHYDLRTAKPGVVSPSAATNEAPEAGLRASEAMEVGQANNYAAQPSVAMSFENDNFKGNYEEPRQVPRQPAKQAQAAAGTQNSFRTVSGSVDEAAVIDDIISQSIEAGRATPAHVALADEILGLADQFTASGELTVEQVRSFLHGTPYWAFAEWLAAPGMRVWKRFDQVRTSHGKGLSLRYFPLHSMYITHTPSPLP